MVRIDCLLVHGILGVVRHLPQLSLLPPLRAVGNAAMDVGAGLEPESLERLREVLEVVTLELELQQRRHHPPTHPRPASARDDVGAIDHHEGIP